MLSGKLIHQIHYNLVLVVGQVGVSKYRSELELVRGRFVVACFQGDSELVPRYLEVSHKGGDSRRDGSEIMVSELLILGGIMAHEGPSRNHQIGPGRIETLVDKEVFLLPAEV